MGAGWLAELKNEPHDIYSKNRRDISILELGNRDSCFTSLVTLGLFDIFH